MVHHDTLTIGLNSFLLLTTPFLRFFSGCITLEFPTCFVIGAYVQNTGTDQKTMPQRRAWNRDLLKYIDELEPRVKKAQKKNILHLGDFNVLPELKGSFLPSFFSCVSACIETDSLNYNFL